MWVGACGVDRAFWRCAVDCTERTSTTGSCPAHPLPASACPAADFPAAPLFDPRQGQLLSESSDWRTATPAAQGMAVSRGAAAACWPACWPAALHPTCQHRRPRLPRRPPSAALQLGRLPTLYNADLGLFVANSGRWSVAPAEIRVLHYTLAQFKP